MKSETKTRKQMSPIVSQWREGGLSRQSFCEQEHLSLAAFAGRIKKKQE